MILKSMSTCITHWITLSKSRLTWITDIVVFLDFEKYVYLYHQCNGYHWIASPNSMLTWITDIHSCGFLIPKSMLTWWSMLTCITHVRLRCYEVCWQPMCVLNLMKYADLHHPGVFWILWIMLTCITHVHSRSYEACTW